MLVQPRFNRRHITTSNPIWSIDVIHASENRFCFAIFVIRANLTRQQHALVDDGARRHRGHVEFLPVREIERLPDNNPDQLGVPDSVFIRPTVIAIFDNVEDSIVLVTPVFPAPGIDVRAAEGELHLELRFDAEQLARVTEQPEAWLKEDYVIDAASMLPKMLTAGATRVRRSVASTNSDIIPNKRHASRSVSVAASTGV